MKYYSFDGVVNLLPKPGFDVTEEAPEPSSYRLMEYLFMLPAILAVSPLFVAWRHTKDEATQETMVFVFRMMTLAWLWMLCAIILYFWRPSLREKFPFVHNVLKTSCLGCLAIAPVVLSSLALANNQQLEVSLYTSFEKITAWVVIVLCVLINAWALRTSYVFRQKNQSISVWEIMSISVLATLGFMVFWLQ